MKSIYKQFADAILGNRKNAFGIERAKKEQIPCTYHNIIPFRGRYPGDEKAAKLAYDDEYVLPLSDA